MNGNIDESVNNLNSDFVNVVVDGLFDDQAMVNTSCSGSLVDNNFCKKAYLSQRVFSLGDARITVPLGGRGMLRGLQD